MRRSFTIIFAALSALLLTSVIDAYTWDDWTPLDEYVNSDDGFYSYERLGVYDHTNALVYIYKVTSQKWQDESFTSQSVWWHYVGVAVPFEVRHKEASFMYIAGQDMDFPEPNENCLMSKFAAKIANDTYSIGGFIFLVPNQPEVFGNDPSARNRTEDEIVSWTWRTYLDSPTPDPTVLLRMPMTKAAKMGLDTIHNVAKELEPSTHLDKFLVMGMGKRGWTAYSLAATDQRVVALAAGVFSMINIPATAMGHFESMNGAWTYAYEPYFDDGITAELYNPKFDDILNVEDMYRYFDRLVGIPKLEILSSGDEYFMPDDNVNYWKDLPGPKWAMVLPNADHLMAPHYPRILQTIIAWWTSIIEEIPLPEISWIMQETELGGLIVIDTIPQPYNITAFVATTRADDNRRDFRQSALGASGEPEPHSVRWTEDINVVDFGNGYQYGAAAEKIPGEWVAFFIQCVYEGPPPTYYKMFLTTQVNIVPYTKPRGPCLTNEECRGYLV